MNRKFIFVCHSVHNTTSVINYDAGNSALNTFLWHFDIWNSNGHFALCSDGEHQKVSFECSKEFYDLVKTEDFQMVFRRMGVIVTFDYSDVAVID